MSIEKLSNINNDNEDHIDDNIDQFLDEDVTDNSQDNDNNNGLIIGRRILIEEEINDKISIGWL